MRSVGSIRPEPKLFAIWQQRCDLSLLVLYASNLLLDAFDLCGECMSLGGLHVCSVCRCAVATNAAGGDQQFLQISFTPAATAAFPAVSQPTVLVTPAVATNAQHLPVLAATSQAVVPGSHAWMQVTSLPPVIVKQEKCALTFSTPSTMSNLSNNRY